MLEPCQGVLGITQQFVCIHPICVKKRGEGQSLPHPPSIFPDQIRSDLSPDPTDTHASLNYSPKLTFSTHYLGSRVEWVSEDGDGGFFFVLGQSDEHKGLVGGSSSSSEAQAQDSTGQCEVEKTTHSFHALYSFNVFASHYPPFFGGRTVGVQKEVFLSVIYS